MKATVFCTTLAALAACQPVDRRPQGTQAADTVTPTDTTAAMMPAPPAPAAIPGSSAPPAAVAARQRIVEGAVGMVEMALDMLSRRDIVTLDNERKAAMVSNLLVVLCGDKSTQPIVNTGTIYQ